MQYSAAIQAPQPKKAKTTTDKITVFVVDDDHDFRETLRLPLEGAGFAVSTYGSAKDFLDGYEGDGGGCLLLDVRMPGTSGLVLQEELSRRGSSLPIIFLTGYGEIPTAVRALKQGALDFLQKPFDEAVLIERIRAAVERDRANRETQAKVRSLLERYQSLSERERDVMRRMVAGEASKVIAIDLGLSLKTVELHRRSVMQKMQVDSIPALVEAALALERAASA